MRPQFFNDVEKELVKVLPTLLTAYGETGFTVSTLKQNTPTVTQYVLRSEGGEIINNVFKAEDVVLVAYIKKFTSENDSYAEGKRIAMVTEALLPMLPKYSTVVSYVEDVSLNVNDFNSVSDVYTVMLSFTVYHKSFNV